MSVKRRYEAHLTFDKDHAEILRHGYYPWEYSAIDNDPIMGQHPYCYLTNYGESARDLVVSIDRVTLALWDIYRISPLRSKIEKIIYDSKTGWNQLEQERAVMLRPAWEQVACAFGYVQCTCGTVLQHREALREHWQMGHFDEATS